MSRDRDMVAFSIDGQEVEARPGTLLLPVARALGFEIPSLCHEDGVGPYASCRLCLVEADEGRRTRIVTACDYPVRDGLAIRTSTPRVDALRRSVIRLHLARAPRSPEIRAIAARLGVASPEGLRENDRDERCILCGLCARVCAEVVGAHAIGMAGRGGRKRITLPFDEEGGRECIGCGACSWICPTRCVEMERIAIERIRSRWGEARPCRYALLRIAPGTVCPRDYDCPSCPVDHEMFERAGGRHPAFLRPPEDADGGGHG